VKLEFVKMNGAANDFIMVDNRSGRIRLSRETVAGCATGAAAWARTG
jgi:diaminopimelate epimerase